ncbi:MAG: Hsp20/alpha crystallin family protein [Calditrichaeota bacterium]|nr:MAG: Hsp20/alpha crystallin family protein [Calditrichota bacterium]
MSIIRWNPEKSLFNFEKEMNNLLDNFGIFRKNDEAFDNAVWSPLTDIVEEKDNFVLRLDLPGLNREDVKINFTNNTLSVSGERKFENETKDKNYHRVERAYGKFYRSFTLPKEVKQEEIDANFKNGQLTISIPKAEEAKPKEIEIKVS